MIEFRRKKGLDCEIWKTPEDVMRWWTDDNWTKTPTDVVRLFDEEDLDADNSVD